MTVRAMSMKRLVAAMTVTAGLALAAACGSSSMSAPSPTGTTGTGGTAPQADVMITINGMAGSNSYTPSPATVKVGQTVSWQNKDSIAHTATGSGFDTGAIASGATSAPITFSAAATINYQCSFHPSMVGVLTVQ